MVIKLKEEVLLNKVFKPVYKVLKNGAAQTVE